MIAPTPRYSRSTSALLALCAGGATLAFGTLLYILDDARYGFMLLMLFIGVIALVFFREKKTFFTWILITSISFRVVNANIGKRFPALEYAFPTLNLFEVLLIGGILYLSFRLILLNEPVRFPRTLEHAIFVLFVTIFGISLFFVTPVWEWGVQRTMTVFEMYLFYLLVYNIWTSTDDVALILRVLLGTVLIEAGLVSMEVVLGDSSPLQRFIAGTAVAQIDAEGIVAARRIAGSFGDFGSHVERFLNFFDVLSSQKTKNE